MSFEAIRLTIGGRVQGVGFRISAVEQASRVGASGWVRNRRDGAVEMHVEGTPDAVDEMRRWSHRGPPGARVEGVTEALVEPQGVEGFEIRR